MTPGSSALQLDFLPSKPPGKPVFEPNRAQIEGRLHRYLVVRRRSVAVPGSPYSKFTVLDSCWDMLQSQ